MPQMMPINWLMIFLLCLLCLFLMMILINSMMLFFKLKNFKYIFFYKKWKWLW